MNPLLQKLTDIKNEKDQYLVPENVRKDVEVLGVTGTLEELDTSDATATAEDMASGKTAYVNGQKITGALPESQGQNVFDNWGTTVVSDNDELQFQGSIFKGSKCIGIRNMPVTIHASNSKVANAIQLKTNQIKQGETVLGITGSVVELQGQIKTVTPTTEQQVITPDQGYNGLTQVTVEAVEDLTPQIQAQEQLIAQLQLEVINKAGNGGIDWSEIGYTGTPDAIIDGFNYAKQIKDNWDPNVTSLYGRFNKDTNLLVFPLVDTSKVTNFSGFCENARHLIYIPLIDTSQATTLQNAFNGVTIAEFPELDTSSCTNFGGAFGNNKALKHFKTINTAKGKDFTNMFKDNEQLQDVELLDLSSATNLSNMFINCNILTDYSLNNIMQMCINATSYTGTKTLRQLGLSSNRANRATQLENYTAFVEAGWTTGY